MRRLRLAMVGSKPVTVPVFLQSSISMTSDPRQQVSAWESRSLQTSSCLPTAAATCWSPVEDADTCWLLQRGCMDRTCRWLFGNSAKVTHCPPSQAAGLLDLRRDRLSTGFVRLLVALASLGSAAGPASSSALDASSVLAWPTVSLVSDWL
jgi:hypothetical protein